MNIDPIIKWKHKVRNSSEQNKQDNQPQPETDTLILNGNTK